MAGVSSESFASRHGLWSAEQHAAAARVRAEVAQAEIGVVRLAFSDAHGVLRGKALVAEEAMRLLDEGATATTTLLLKDLSGKTAFAVYTPGGGLDLPQMRGACDMVMLADPTSFRILPWAPHTGWLLCDLHLGDGTPVPLCTRALLRRQLARLAARQLQFVAGIEIECHILRQDGGTAGTLLNKGYQYLTELRHDELDPLFELLRRNLQALDLPLRSIEVEFGPSQVELTFGPGTGMEPADTMMLVRAAVKQTCQRAGYVASFMCRPRLPDVVSSGWHLHQSLRHVPDGTNAFAGAAGLSPLGRAWLAGLLAHAVDGAVFAAPTINGYKRYRPYSNAPTRATWAHDNRGVMLRVLGRPGDPATRIENRAGEPAANPYLTMAAQIAAGLDGIDRGLDPGAPSDQPYESDAPRLPGSLMEALAALQGSALFAEEFGRPFVDYLVRLKQAEIERFLAEVTEWEQAEYFSLL